MKNFRPLWTLLEKGGLTGLLLLSAVFSAATFAQRVDVEIPEEVKQFNFKKDSASVPNNLRGQLIALKNSSLTLRTKNNSRLGSAVFVELPSGSSFLSGIRNGIRKRKSRFLLLTAKHVVQSLCRGSVPKINAQAYWGAIQLDCPRSFSKESKDLFFWEFESKEKFHPSLKNATVLKLGTFGARYDKHYSGLSFCAVGLSPEGEFNDGFYFTGDYIAGYTEGIPGCSGSGLVIGGKLVGILKGFHRALKEPLYTLVEKTDFSSRGFSKSEIVTRGFNASRGDPADGGSGLQGEFLFLNEDLGSLPYLPTPQRILHVPLPAVEAGGTIPTQFDTQYAKRKRHGELMSCRGNMAKAVGEKYVSTWRDTADYSKSWPFDLSRFMNVQYEMQHQISLSEPKDNKSNWLLKLWPFAMTKPKYANRVDKDVVYIKGNDFEIILKPGQLVLADKKIGLDYTTFDDQNICYRSVVFKSPNSSQLVVYNIEINASDGFAVKKNQQKFQSFVQRAIFDDYQALLDAKASYFEVFHLVIRNHEFKMGDWGQ